MPVVAKEDEGPQAMEQATRQTETELVQERQTEELAKEMEQVNRQVEM